jgi:hypothetical protein
MRTPRGAKMRRRGLRGDQEEGTSDGRLDSLRFQIATARPKILIDYQRRYI